MLFSCNSSSFTHFLRVLYHSSTMLKYSKLKFSCSSSDPDLRSVLAFTHLFDFRVFLPRWSQDHLDLHHWPGAFWISWTTYNLLRRHERSPKLTLWIWVVLASPYMSSYNVNVHAKSTYVVLFCFCILFWTFYGLVLLFDLRQLGGLVELTRLIFFVVSFTLCVENLLGSF